MKIGIVPVNFSEIVDLPKGWGIELFMVLEMRPPGTWGLSHPRKEDSLESQNGLLLSDGNGLTRFPSFL